MMHRLSVLWSAGGLLASALLALSTVQGVSAANADVFQDWSGVSAGGFHSCGIRNGGELYCWGNDSDGAVGDGDENSEAIKVPTRVGTFEDWDRVDGGGYQTCGIRHGGKLYCWGKDDFGQVGDGGENSASIITPRRIGAFEDWAIVSAGGFHTCGVRKNGKLYCWGDDGNGQVGDGAGSGTIAPRRIGESADWTTVSAGSYHTCAIRAGGLYCWGDDESGQVGDGGENPTAVFDPVHIDGFADWANVSAGASHSCGVRKNGKLYCWGDDQSGQIGDGDAVGAAITPRRIGAFADWSTATAGGSHTCGIRHGGKLYCWGHDSFLEVGDGMGDSTPVKAPRRIGDFEDWAAVSSGTYHTCGARENGKLYCWGLDSNGQVGDGEAFSAASPRRI